MNLFELFMQMRETSQDDEAAHFAALDKTGFYGKAGAGCLFLARDTGRLLLGHRSDHPPPQNVEQPGTWGTFGGAINPREDPIAAVKREVKEETGFTGTATIEPLLVFKKNDFRYNNFLLIVEREFTPSLNWENQGFQWCRWGDWPQPLHFGLVSLFRDQASAATMQRLAGESNPQHE